MDIKRLQGTLYGIYLFSDYPVYLKSVITFAQNAYDDTRFTAQSDYTATEWNAFIEKGYKIHCGNVQVVPKMSLMYSHLNPHSYIEYGDPTRNLHVFYDAMETLPLGLGLSIDYQNTFPKAYVVPEFHGMFFHDFIHDAQSAQFRLLNVSGFTQTVGPKPYANSVELGVGLVVHSFTNVMIRCQYDFVYSADYHRHQAFIKARYEWA